MKKAPSERGWAILQRYVLERAKRIGPDGDLADDEKADQLQQAADDAQALLQDPKFQKLRLQGLDEVVQGFADWLNLDPAGPNYEKELAGIHQRTAARYWELFRPEALIHEAKEQLKKLETKEGPDGGRKKR